MIENWLHVRNESSGTTADIYVTDVIDNWFGIGKNQFIDAIRSSGATSLNIHISSPGGNVDDALAMHDYLKGFNGKTVAKLSGIVASAATFLALGAQTVEMSENALFMIHNVSGMAWGDAGDMRKTADVIDKLQERIVNIYQKKTNSNGKNLKASQIDQWMQEETWMTAQEAKDRGFIDTVTDRVKMTNRVDISSLQNRGFTRIPQDKINALNQTEDTDMKEVIDSVLQAIKDGFAELKNSFSPKAENAEIEAKIAAKATELEQGFTAQITEAVNAATLEATNKVTELTTEVSSLTTERDTLTNVVTEKDAEIARLTSLLEAKGVQPTHAADPLEKPVTKNTLFPGWREELVASITPTDKAIINEKANKK